jgi:hypothetical protein
MRWAALGIVGVLLAGCGNRNAISDVRIVNAPVMTGSDRLTTCDTCGARSECGSASNSTRWASEHYRQTGHAAFTRRSCRGDLDPSMGVRSSPPRELPSQDEQRREADRKLTRGMLYSQACFVLGQSGVVEQGTEKVKTVRFRQSISDGTRVYWRDLWADFDTGTSRLVDVKYGVWKE